MSFAKRRESLALPRTAVVFAQKALDDLGATNERVDEADRWLRVAVASTIGAFEAHWQQTLMPPVTDSFGRLVVATVRELLGQRTVQHHQVTPLRVSEAIAKTHAAIAPGGEGPESITRAQHLDLGQMLDELAKHPWTRQWSPVPVAAGVLVGLQLATLEVGTVRDEESEPF